jgi:cobalamin biosynthesis Mg chelatase CobN
VNNNWSDTLENGEYSRMMRSENSTSRKYQINFNQIKRMNEVNKMEENQIPPGTGIQESHQYRRSQSETDGTKQHYQSFVSKDSKRGSSIIHIEAYERSSAQLQDMGSVFDNLQRKRGSRKKWKQFLRSKLDSVPFIIASIVFTLLVSLLMCKDST